MKLLIMCEGPNEKEIINILLENKCLKFTEDDLLGLTPYHARQIRTSGQVKTELNLYPGNDVKILRIGDALNEKLVIPAEYREKIQSVEKYCTKPELEMLLINAEDLTKEYEKVKSQIKPKIFAKNNIQNNKKRYDNSTKFYREYFGENAELLTEILRKYKQTKSHKRDEKYLADLLKDT